MAAYVALESGNVEFLVQMDLGRLCHYVELE